MIYFISGGVRSGKSSFAEDLVKKNSKDRRIYLATAKVYDEEMRARVNKHIKDRMHDNWITIEAATDLSKIEGLKKSDTLLLDCLTNLVANEMFDYGLDSASVIEKVCADLEILATQVDSLVIVSNDIFSAIDDYSSETMEYVKALGRIHCHITNIARESYEMSYKIPIRRN